MDNADYFNNLWPNFVGNSAGHSVSINHKHDERASIVESLISYKSKILADQRVLLVIIQHENHLLLSG